MLAIQIVDSTDPILNPSIVLGLFEWREPVTTLTDSLTAFVCIYAFLVFYAYKGAKSESFKYFRAFFLCFGIGMFCASWLGHGFTAYLSPRWKVIGWVMNSVANLLLGLGILTEIAPLITPRIRQGIKMILVSQVSIFIALMIIPSTSFFGLAQLSSTFSLVFIVLPMNIFNYVNTKAVGSKYFIIAILMGIIPGIIYNLQWSVSRWFNFHDISHVCMAVIVFIMFLGARAFAFNTTLS